MKHALWITLVLVCCAFGYLGTRQDAPRRAAPVPPAKESLSNRRIFAAGVVEGSQRERALGFELQGRIATIPVTEGQIVRAGEVLATLDDALWRQQLAEARSQLRLAQAERDRLTNGARHESREVARAAVELARIRVEEAASDQARAEQLFEQRALPAQNLQTYRYEYSEAVAQFNHVRAQLEELEAPARPDDVAIADARAQLAASAIERAEILLDQCVLRAPHTGVVLQIDAEPGEVVVPEHRDHVLTMANLDELRVRAFVEEFDALSVLPGQCASILTDGRPDDRISGVVIWAAPAMRPKTRRLDEPGEHLDVDVREILIAIEDPGDLVVGLPVEVFIEPAAQAELAATTLPSTGAFSADPTQSVSVRPGQADQLPAPSGYVDAHPVHVPTTVQERR